jgi:6-phosphogluconolactonase (cycloisomerase 2 family)
LKYYPEHFGRNLSSKKKVDMRIGRWMFAGCSCSLVIGMLAMPRAVGAQASNSRRVEFAYAVNQNANTVSAFRRVGNGELMPLSPPSFPTGNAPNGVAVNPGGTFAYVVNVLSNDVSGYSINPDGTLTALPGSPFPAGSGPGWISIDPTGRFVYVANCAALCSGSGPGSISGYAINKSTGALIPVPGSPFAADQIPYSIAIDPTGAFAYVANFSSNTISIFKINQTSGSLQQIAPSISTGGTSPLYLARDPQGRFLYAVNTQSGDVSAFAIGSDGLLTAAPGSPFPSGEFTQGIAVSSSGEFAYVSAGFQVLGYSIGPNGVLTPLPESPFPAPDFLVSLTTDQSGHFVYGADTFSGVAGYSIDPDSGGLTPLSGSPFPTGGEAFFVTTTVAH